MSNQVIQETQTIEDGQVIFLQGDIDLSRSPALKSALLDVVGKVSRLIVELSNVAYMDSSGVATLVEALQRQRGGGGKMVLCALQPRVLSIFQISRLDTVFTIVDDLDKAKQA